MHLKRIKIIVFCLVSLVTINAQAQSRRLLFKTDYGDFKVMLYDFTPKHQQLILDAINNDVYNKALFNRIIENFVVQGGVHDDDIAQQEINLPEIEKKRLKPEFDPKAIHKIGALGAGRDDNKEKGSFLNQIYFVVGKTVSEQDLEKYEAKRGVAYTKEQQQMYLTQGGLPRLDFDYTVFGEVYQGLEVLLKIATLPTNIDDYPLHEITFSITEIFE